MTVHNQMGIIKALNSNQPIQLCSFSKSIKSGGFSSAKMTDFAVRLNDNALKTGTDTRQLISLIGFVKGLLATYPTELCVIALAESFLLGAKDRPAPDYLHMRICVQTLM